MEFKKGKKVRVVKNSNHHKYPIGSEVVMSEEYQLYFIPEVGDYEDNWWTVRYSDCEEIELTLEEVREHFKDAKEVRGMYSDDLYDVDVLKYGVYNDGNGVFRQCNDENDFRVMLVNGDSFAEIVSYKSEETTALDAYNKHHQTNYTQDKPARYKSREVNGMDVIDLGEHWGLNFQEANILKYLLRDKGEDEQDMVKIADYAKRELELIKQRKNK